MESEKELDSVSTLGGVSVLFLNHWESVALRNGEVFVGKGSVLYSLRDAEEVWLSYELSPLKVEGVLIEEESLRSGILGVFSNEEAKAVYAVEGKSFLTLELSYS